MSKLRSVSTSFWSDPFIEQLAPKEKLLFLYLITNDKTNMLGIYENTIRKMAFETGLTTQEVETILKRLEGFGKVKYMNNWVLLVNYMKHQNYNPNMKKSAIDCYNDLPNELKIKDLLLDRGNPLEAFETLSKHLGIVRKVEVEVEGEYKGEYNISSDFDFFLDSLNKMLGKRFTKADKYKKQFQARLNGGFSIEQILTALKNAKNDKYHIETSYKYLTPEFILRVDKLDKFLNIQNSELPEKEFYNGKEVFVDKKGDKWYMDGDTAKRIYPLLPDFTGWTSDEIYNYMTCSRFTDKESMMYTFALDSQNNTTEAEKRGIYKHYYNQETLQMRYADHDNIRTS